LKANITIGEIKHRANTSGPSLEANVQLTIGGIKSATDFLYLSP